MTDGPPAAVGHVANPGRQRDLGRENAVLRELVTVYRQLSGLALQDAGLASVTQLIADRTAAIVAVVSPLLDVIAAASPGIPAEKAADVVRQAVAGPRLGQVLRASREGHRPLWLPSVAGMPAVAPLGSFQEADYLAHEVPDVHIPVGVLQAMQSAGRPARETGLQLAADLLRAGRPLVSGVLLAGMAPDAAALGPLLAATGRAGLRPARIQ